MIDPVVEVPFRPSKMIDLRKELTYTYNRFFLNYLPLIEDPASKERIAGFCRYIIQISNFIQERDSEIS